MPASLEHQKRMLRHLEKAAAKPSHHAYAEHVRQLLSDFAPLTPQRNTMPSTSAIAIRLNSLGLTQGSDFELSATDCDLLERALNHYADHCSTTIVELSLLNPAYGLGESHPMGFYRRQRDRCHALRDIFEMSVQVKAIEVGCA